MKKLLKFLKRLFRSNIDNETAEVINTIENDGKIKINVIELASQDILVEQEKVVKDLLSIMEEQHELEIEKSKAEVRLAVQQKIADVKQKAIDIKDKEKKEKIKQIKLFLDKV